MTKRNVRAVQHAFSVALDDEKFYLDCVELELDTRWTATAVFYNALQVTTRVCALR